jgi:hypothetical protein
MKRTWAGEVRNVSLLVASAVNSEGCREILGICEGAKEDKSGWSAFLRHLVDRGLSGVQLISPEDRELLVGFQATEALGRFHQALDHVTGFMNLAALDRRVGAEGSTDDFAQRLGAVDDEQPADLRIEPALNQIVDQRLHHGGILSCSLDQTERMLVAFAIDAKSGNQHQVVADMQAVDLDDPTGPAGTGPMPSTRPAVRPTAPRTGARPPTSRCRLRRRPADHPQAAAQPA